MQGRPMRGLVIPNKQRATQQHTCQAPHKNANYGRARYIIEQIRHSMKY